MRMAVRFPCMVSKLAYKKIYRDILTTRKHKLAEIKKKRNQTLDTSVKSNKI